MTENTPDWVPGDLRQLYRRLSPNECEQLRTAYEGANGRPALDVVYAIVAGRFNEHLPLLFADARRKLFEALAKDELSKAMTELWRLPLVIEKRIHDAIAELPTIPAADRESRPLESE